ncbi:hypothetical protein AMTRI_Chr10g225560 [Amborella trichopoda]
MFYEPFFRACTSTRTLLQIHAQLLVTGLHKKAQIATKLVNVYSKFGDVEPATLVFRRVTDPDAFLYGVMMKSYVWNGFFEEPIMLYHDMLLLQLLPGNFTYPPVLRACSGLNHLIMGKKIHGIIIQNGFESDNIIQTSLVHMYTTCSCLDDARKVFDRILERDVVSWSSMVSGYAHNGRTIQAIETFSEMSLRGVEIDSVTLLGVTQAFSNVGSLKQGKLIHGYLLRRGISIDWSVENSLISLYINCGCLDSAHKLFSVMPEKSVVLWNKMVTIYAQNGLYEEALRLFSQMMRQGFGPDSFTFAVSFSSCANLGNFVLGSQAYCVVIKTGFESNEFVHNSLIDMHCKCGFVCDAWKIFENIEDKGLVAWNSMICGYGQNGNSVEAITLFDRMLREYPEPNRVTFLSAIQACSHLGFLEKGRWIHQKSITHGFDNDSYVSTSLIDMYAKCGDIEMARKVFENMREKNVVSWSAMIAGYGMHGYLAKAISLFKKMEGSCVKPNTVTFVSMLSASSHSGSVETGWFYFVSMKRDYQIIPILEHYACMVDLLSRAGQLDDAYEFIASCPVKPNASMWGALLGGCKIYQRMDLIKDIQKHILELEPENDGYYVLLSNIYADSGRWEDFGRLRTMMKDMGIKKAPGYSLVEMNGKAHKFVAGDTSHPKLEEVMRFLESMESLEEEERGYPPLQASLRLNIEEERKEIVLRSHSEKLAMAFGIISTNPGVTIRITKNLRICSNCHSFTKFVAKVTGREIIMRDLNRFHHFKDGSCSCGEYW